MNLLENVKANLSLEVTLQSRVGIRGISEEIPWQRFCCGLGARPVRAGSIGRDTPAHTESLNFRHTFFPPTLVTHP